MPKIEFGYNLETDAWSWVLIAKSKDLWGLDWKTENSHVPEDLMKKILKASFPAAQKSVLEYISQRSERKKFEAIIHSELKALETIWRKAERKYFKILEQITGKPIYTDKFACFFTTGYMCPYDEKENRFMVSMWHSLPSSITTICHETFHFQFLHNYKKYLKRKGLKVGQIETLKESLTFLLNEPEFKEVISSADQGYPKHQKLRKDLEKIWRKEKDFKKLLDSAISLLIK